ncbi:uncharacterized protein METZ01_LOCUS448764, partial [marine metagenome]
MLSLLYQLYARLHLMHCSNEIRASKRLPTKSTVWELDKGLG